MTKIIQKSKSLKSIKKDMEITEIQYALKLLFTDMLNMAKTIDIIYKKDLKFFAENKKQNEKFIEMLEELKKSIHTH